MSKELVVRTPTRKIYDAVVAQAVAEGKHSFGSNPWNSAKEQTCVNVSTSYLAWGTVEYYERHSSEYKLIEAKDYLKEKTMENLQAGDILVNDDIDFSREVQGVIGKAVIVIDNDDQTADLYDIGNLKSKGWKLKDSDPEIIELTLAEVSERLNIPKLRIKE